VGEGEGLDILSDPAVGTPDALPPADVPATKAWEKTAAEVVMLNTRDHHIATVWHPDAIGEVVVTAHGNVRALVGPKAQYQLTTGEIIAL
jgi:hypothetical protein